MVLDALDAADFGVLVKVERRHADRAGDVVVGVGRRAQMRLVGEREGGLALLRAEEVDAVEGAVVLEEVLEVAQEGRERRLNGPRDGNLGVERLAAALLPEHCRVRGRASEDVHG